MVVALEDVKALDERRASQRDVRDFVTFRLVKTYTALNAQAGDILRNHCGLGLVQWRVMALTAVHGPDISGKRLSEIFSMDKGLISRTVKQLTADGYLQTKRDGGDHRRLLLSLTDLGWRVHDNTIALMEKRQAHLTHDMDADEHAALLSALDKLAANARRRAF